MHGLCSDFVWLAAVNNAFFFSSPTYVCANQLTLGKATKKGKQELDSEAR